MRKCDYGACNWFLKHIAVTSAREALFSYVLGQSGRLDQF